MTKLTVLILFWLLVVTPLLGSNIPYYSSNDRSYWRCMYKGIYYQLFAAGVSVSFGIVMASLISLVELL